ncbi:kinase [Brachybacterium sp. JB7]|uniref:aminoglycoside phosphotransferase family protein n=1 Tax=Brachybacterium sp. JB7 TaxID=2024478 RepID=UPI000DF275A3|nr:aminoglycoside phosphotransferase family protein [Brachybacterium sp. JB7]RCS66327.1 kinase [Brachybacterium sp. JB7]
MTPPADPPDPPDPSAPALVAGFPLPEQLAAADDRGVVAWRAGLDGVVTELLSQWDLIPAAPFEPGGSSAWVAPVRDQAGADLVLKVAWAHEESRDEAAGMTAWQGRGAATVHRSERRGATSVLLMEKVVPGTELAQLLTWPERDEVVASMLRRLWVTPEELLPTPERTPFRPLAHMCAWWADEAQARAEAGHSPLPGEVVQRGLELFRSLPQDWDGEQVLLATDFHHHNVLARGEDGSREWVLIDPKPYVGDPHYDLLQHMLNDADRLRARPGAFADRMAELTGLDPARSRRWLFARCVQEAGVADGAAEAAMRLADDGVG